MNIILNHYFPSSDEYITTVGFGVVAENDWLLDPNNGYRVQSFRPSSRDLHGKVLHSECRLPGDTRAVPNAGNSDATSVTMTLVAVSWLHNRRFHGFLSVDFEENLELTTGDCIDDPNEFTACRELVQEAP